MHGILILNKPPGITSRQAVNQIQKLVRPAKVGHAGTLDPLATGVLVCCVGAATRLIQYIQQMPKRYVGEFEFGKVSDTEDIGGEVIHLENPPKITQSELFETLPNFMGEIQQTPPAFSALHVNGKRAYELARSGKKVQLKPRPIMIHDLKLVSYNYPFFKLEIHCGSGTYVRSLGRDIAEALRTGAIMTKLERTAIGEFDVNHSILPENIDLQSLAHQLLPLSAAVGHLPAVVLTEAEQFEFNFGRNIKREIVRELTLNEPQQEVAALSEDGQLIAMMQQIEENLWKPAKNFASLINSL